MKLTELLNIVSDDKKHGMVNIDDWKFNDAAHLKDMGFDFDGDYMFAMKDPAMKIYKKKTPQGECFVLEEVGKPERVFKTFEEAVTYFEHYPQPEIDKELS